MPAKTNTEAIRDLERAVASVEERDEGLRRDLDRIDGANAKTAELLTKTETRVAVLEEKVAAIQKNFEETDRKRWMVIVAPIGCVLTLAANIAISFLRLAAGTLSCNTQAPTE